jgi:hypothetical protein
MKGTKSVGSWQLASRKKRDMVPGNLFVNQSQAAPILLAAILTALIYPAITKRIIHSISQKKQG